MSRPTDAEIREQINKTHNSTDEGTTAVPGMTYEEGVQAALNWALGDWDDKPMEDD